MDVITVFDLVHGVNNDIALRENLLLWLDWWGVQKTKPCFGL